MNKKSMEIAPNSVVVVIVLLVLVLLVLIFIFGNSSLSFLKTIVGLTDQTTLVACNSPFMMRYCNKCPDGYSETVVPLPPPKDGKDSKWSDCTGTCYECSK